MSYAKSILVGQTTCRLEPLALGSFKTIAVLHGSTRLVNCRFKCTLTDGYPSSNQQFQEAQQLILTSTHQIRSGSDGMRRVFPPTLNVGLMKTAASLLLASLASAILLWRRHSISLIQVECQVVRNWRNPCSLARPHQICLETQSYTSDAPARCVAPAATFKSTTSDHRHYRQPILLDPLLCIQLQLLSRCRAPMTMVIQQHALAMRQKRRA